MINLIKKLRKKQDNQEEIELNENGNKTNSDEPNLLGGASTQKDVLSPSVIRNLKPSDETIHGPAGTFWVEVGNTITPVRYFRSFFADVLSGTTHGGMFDQLYAGDFTGGDIDIGIHIEPADSSKILFELSREISGVESELYNCTSTSERARLTNKREDLLQKQDRIRRNIERPFFAAFQVTVSGTELSDLKRLCASVIRRYSGQSIFLKAADTRQLTALRALTPIDENDSFFRNFYKGMETSNVADMFPFGQGSISHRDGIVLGYDPMGKIIFFDNWHRNVSNYNMLIFGRSGAGKSFACKLIIARSVAQNIQTFIIDVEGEFEALVRELGCPYIELSPRSDWKINIFEVEVAKDEQGNQKVLLEDSVKAVQAVVFKMLKTISEDALTGQVKMLIQEKIWDVYRDKGISEDPESLFTKSSEVTEEGKRRFGRAKKSMPTLSDLYFKMVEDERLEEATEIIRTFTRQGNSPTQAIFDCESNVDIENSPLAAINITDLDQDVMRPIGLFICTKFFWEKASKNPLQKNRLVADESQEIVNEDNIETAKWMENAFRKSRKRNISMTAITQGFEVFTRVKQGEGILKNSSTKLILKQEPIDIESVETKFNLTAGESQFLLSASKGAGILQVEDESAIVQVTSTKEEYKLFTTDPNEVDKSQAKDYDTITNESS